jgi:hypothetical protein
LLNYFHLHFCNCIGCLPKVTDVEQLLIVSLPCCETPAIFDNSHNGVLYIMSSNLYSEWLPD